MALADAIEIEEQVLAIAEVQDTCPWVSRHVVKEIETANKIRHKALARLKTTKAIHTMSNLSAFEGKQFEQLRADVQKAIDHECKHTLILKTVFIQQGLMAPR